MTDRRWWWVGVTAAVLGAAGCQYDPYQYRGLSLADSVAIINTRPRAASSMTAECVVRIADDTGRRATLDGAIAAMPDALRLQAWRGQRTIMDITAQRDGLWLTGEAADDLTMDAQADAALPTGLAAAVWGAMTGSAIDEHHGAWTVTNADLLTWQGETAAGERVAVVFDRATLKARQWRWMLDDERSVEIRLDDYRPVGDVTHLRDWPHEVEIHAPGQRIELSFRDVVLDDALSDATFAPPRGAVHWAP